MVCWFNSIKIIGVAIDNVQLANLFICLLWFNLNTRLREEINYVDTVRKIGY